jgi:hypothetical protein
MALELPKFIKKLTGKIGNTKDFTNMCILPINLTQKLSISSIRINHASQAKGDKIMFTSAGLIRFCSFANESD